MKIVEVKSLAIPAIKLIRFARFMDMRGYFTEAFRKSDFSSQLAFMRDVQFVQFNESFSRRNVVRGMHFQWNPFMGKLVRTVQGRMVDLFLDIRKGSPTYGKAAACDMPSSSDRDYAEWIWIPPGFAHGNFFTQDTTIEYVCSGEYSQGCEAGISPLAADIDWSLCDRTIKQEFDAVVANSPIMTEKDRDAPTMGGWTADKRSNEFLYNVLGDR